MILERECFPPALRFGIGADGALTGQREEPIAADARPERDGKDLAKLKVVAGLLDLPLDEIVLRAERARRKRVRNWGAALVLLTVTFAGLAIWADVNRREAETQQSRAEQETIRAKANLSSALTALAFIELKDRPVDAVKLALAAWPRIGELDLPKREVTLNSLSRSLADLHQRMSITANAVISSVAFSPDGAHVLIGSAENTARLWDAVTGKELRAFKGHTGSVQSVAFSQDGASVLTGASDATARLWDAATGKELRAFKGHGGGVMSVAFSPDGARVLTGSDDARLWDVTSGEQIRVFRVPLETVSSVAFSPDGKGVLTANGKAARLWDVATGKQIQTFKGHEDDIRSVAFSPDGARVLTASFDKTARLWDASTGKQIRAFQGHESDDLFRRV